MKWLKLISWYLFFTLFLLEVAARIAYAIPTTRQRLSSLDEASWRRAWIEKKKKSDRFVFSFDIFDPHTGWISRSNIRDQKVWKNKYLNTNDL